MKKHLLICLLLLLPAGLSAQGLRPFHIRYDFRKDFFVNDSLPSRARSRAVTGIAAGGYAVTMTYLGLNWYAKQPLVPFHFFDDSREWLQYDKVGHALGCYSSARLMIDLYKWSGVEKRKALIRGGVAGFMAMNSIEVFDGFGEGWGFSWSDVAANFTGVSLAVANQWAWNENRVQLKVSWRKSPYAGVDSLQRLFGTNPAEWFLKDYNGQTTWLSFRVHSFLPEGRFKDHYPRWLNLAVGYGGEGMIGGYGRDSWEDIRAREYRQLYLSFDIDLSNIRTRSGFLHSLFSTVSVIRIPMPAIRFDRTGVAFRAYE
jgi:Predicted periplasmic lipoprotein (DUF2279)